MTRTRAWIVVGVAVVVASTGIVLVTSSTNHLSVALDDDPCALVPPLAIALTVINESATGDVVKATEGHDAPDGSRCDYRYEGKPVVSLRAREINDTDLRWVALTAPPKGETEDTTLCGAVVREYTNVTDFVGTRWTVRVNFKPPPGSDSTFPDRLARSIAASVAENADDVPSFLDQRSQC